MVVVSSLTVSNKPLEPLPSVAVVSDFTSISIVALAAKASPTENLPPRFTFTKVSALPSCKKL